jgi:hypothetical protein
MPAIRHHHSAPRLRWPLMLMLFATLLAGVLTAILMLQGPHTSP